ncbi:hypothetical protein [Ideonella sp.]|uniref:hypothetical protein n=1 Tax=Ideonella sp. TaxID=1929293 RepID=UPI0035B4BBA4
MTIRARLALAACLLAAQPAAHAQRTPVPVMDFIDVPVSLATDRPQTAETVQAAFLRAAPRRGWQVQPEAPGTLKGVYEKGEKHRVVVAITYDAQRYSVRYVDSVNMKYGDAPMELSVARSTRVAAAEQRAMFMDRPESAYAKPSAFVIHPFYERWVHELLSAVRSELGASAGATAVPPAAIASQGAR